MTKFIMRYISNEDGATAIEYGLIAASITLAIAATLFVVSGELDTTFTAILTNLTSIQS